MAFELRDRDLLGRIGRLQTKSGVIETPAFMPVINPVLQTLPPRRMKKEFGCDIVITNSYIIKNHFEEAPELNVHKLLDYDGVVMTDSGAYQILVYGEVEVTQPEIIAFQKRIGSDISVILDIPTGWDVPREKVEFTVEETLRRARAALPLIEDSETLWVGPVQGGKHLDLVAHSAQEVGKLPYDIHALGSPTEVMERYNYPVLVDMTMAARLNTPIDRALHLFGAGHPTVFAMSVAMGCDLFDSAAYILYAKDDRYMTNRGTFLLKNLQYLPCNCPVCKKYSAEELKRLPKGERQLRLAEHNLYDTVTEIDTVKQSITEGTLWDLVETRAKAHPQMTAALNRLLQYKDKLEEGSPGFKGKGVFYYDYHSFGKPEVQRHNTRLTENYGQPEGKDVLVLAKAPKQRPFSGFTGYHKLRKTIKDKQQNVMIAFYCAPYGVVPAHLSETYPLSQFEIAQPLDEETIRSTVRNIKGYLESTNWRRVILLREEEEIDGRVEQALAEVQGFECIAGSDIWEAEIFAQLHKTL